MLVENQSYRYCHIGVADIRNEILIGEMYVDIPEKSSHWNKVNNQEDTWRVLDKI